MGIKAFNVWNGKPVSESIKVAERVDLPDPAAIPVEEGDAEDNK